MSLLYATTRLQEKEEEHETTAGGYEPEGVLNVHLGVVDYAPQVLGNVRTRTIEPIRCVRRQHRSVCYLLLLSSSTLILLSCLLSP